MEKKQPRPVPRESHGFVRAARYAPRMSMGLPDLNHVTVEPIEVINGRERNLAAARDAREVAQSIRTDIPLDVVVGSGRVSGGWKRA